MVTRRSRSVGSVWLVAALLASCTTSPSSVAPPPLTHTPANGQPLTDEEGRPYVLQRLAKSQAVRVDERTVRMKWGIPIEIASEDDRYYFYRVYQPGPVTPERTPSVPDEARRIAASYRVEVGESERLRAVEFGRGLPRAGQWRKGVAVADMNGDGHPDIVLPPARKSGGGPAIFLGDGQGSWRR